MDPGGAVPDWARAIRIGPAAPAEGERMRVRQ